MAECEAKARSVPKQLFDDTLPPLYSFILRPDPVALGALAKLTAEISERFPNHYYYPSDRLHGTILGNLLQKDYQEDALRMACTPVLKGRSLVVEPRGVLLTVAGVVVPVYAAGDALHILRQELRGSIGLTQSYAGEHELWEHIGWIQILRFKSEPEPDFVEYILTKHGSIVPVIRKPTLELILTTSKTLQPGTWSVRHTF